jgi:hypothetical protein
VKKTSHGLLPPFILRNKLLIDISENAYLNLWQKKRLNRLNSSIRTEELPNNYLLPGLLLRRKEGRCLLKTRDLKEI